MFKAVSQCHNRHKPSQTHRTCTLPDRLLRVFYLEQMTIGREDSEGYKDPAFSVREQSYSGSTHPPRSYERDMVDVEA